LETSNYSFNVRKEGTGLIVSLVGANTKKAKDEFIKEIKLVGQKDLDALRNIRADNINKVKKFKDLLPKDVIFNAEKQIHDLFTQYSKNLEGVVAAKVQKVESSQ